MEEIKNKLTFSQLGEVCNMIKKAGEDLSLPDVWIYVMIGSVIQQSGVVMTKSWAVAKFKKQEAYA